MKNSLEVRGLCKNYPDFSLKNVSFSLPEGYIMGFIGPNGAGKTTTIKSILNMTLADSGKILLFGQESKQMNGRMNDDIGVVMDAPFYVDDWKMTDVQAAVSPFYSRWNSDTYQKLLHQFGISLEKRVKELSRGMKVKLMMAVALSHDARLLILDEPTSGLDPVARDELCELLGEFVSDEGHSVLFSTHITGDLEKIADYITFILNGEIVYSGLKEDLLERYVLIKGGLKEISAEQKKLIIGLREHPTGFEGITELQNLSRLPNTLLTQSVSLEELIVFMGKEARRHE